MGAGARPEARPAGGLERGLRPVLLRGAGAKPEARPLRQERALRAVRGKRFHKEELGETEKLILDYDFK